MLSAPIRSVAGFNRSPGTVGEERKMALASMPIRYGQHQPLEGTAAKRYAAFVVIG